MAWDAHANRAQAHNVAGGAPQRNEQAQLRVGIKIRPGGRIFWRGFSCAKGAGRMLTKCSFPRRRDDATSYLSPWLQLPSSRRTAGDEERRGEERRGEERRGEETRRSHSVELLVP